MLKQRIEELGGLYSVHLTRDCTHLIVSSCSDGRTVVQSPKYKVKYSTVHPLTISLPVVCVAVRADGRAGGLD